jgi:peptidoglycan/LPS O-acetylase OafA/YrhL
VTPATATTTAPTLSPPERRRTERRRDDIQALRALAVILVVVFHLWPKRMPGGYVGVDVFFVISGFLITSHLIRTPPRSARDVAKFWARRIRRLLPAAFAVIGATAVASWAWLPESQWRSLARDASASALYGENWNLAGGATDYLAAEGAASPYQHFWSLSVEEQFYILWPLLILGVVALSISRARSPIKALGVAIGAVFAASLAASVVVTERDPAAAYFVTHTRMWELALGGLFAVGMAAKPAWFVWPSVTRAAVAWAGLAAIAWSAFALSGATPFPGTAALVPTVAAAAFVAARSETGRWSPGRITRLAPVQFVGDVSYSVYLWHWPIIVILPYATGTALRWPTKIGVLVVTLAIAWASKSWIEDPPQRSARLTRPAWAAGLAVGGMVGVLAVSGVQSMVVGEREHQATTKLANAMEQQGSCAGAGALSPDADCEGGPHGSELLTSPAQAALDRSDLYADGCFSNPPFVDHTTCTYGEQDAPTARIALVGNSHAGHWLPVLQALAEDHGWQITTYVASACVAVDLPQAFKEAGATEGCRTWGRWAIDATIEGDYDVVVTSSRVVRAITGVAPKDTDAAIRRSFTDTLSTWAAADQPVLVLRDTPWSDANVPDCVDQHLDDLSVCDGAEDQRLRRDPMADAALSMDHGSVAVADMTRYLCSEGTCFGTIGGLIAYFDLHHMTVTFARTLAPFVEPYLVRLIPSPGS